MIVQSFWNWIKRLFRKPRPGGKRHSAWPTKEEINLLPWFEGLNRHSITLVANADAAEGARRVLEQAPVVGFDTESKPTFVKGHVSTGPHVAQFSTLDHAFVFMLYEPHCRKTAADLIASKTLKKVGFGLIQDLRQIRSRLHITPHNVLDLETLFRERGFGQGVGAKVGVALMFKRRLQKSRRISSSNWGARHLSPQQILYAANDAYAAMRVYNALASKK